MALYMLFAAVGVLIYTGAAFTTAISGVTGESRAAIASNRSPAVIVPAEPTRPVAAGEQLIQEPGCVQPNGESQ